MLVQGLLGMLPQFYFLSQALLDLAQLGRQRTNGQIQSHGGTVGHQGRLILFHAIPSKLIASYHAHLLRTCRQKANPAVFSCSCATTKIRPCEELV